MNEFKGTQGKLQINDFTFQDEKQENIGVFDIVNKQGSKFAQVAPYEFFGLTLEQAKANAVLISKAPEMLEMLKKASEKLYTVENPSTSCRYLADEIIDLINEATDLSQLEK